jgi:hypothetical protein
VITRFLFLVIVGILCVTHCLLTTVSIGRDAFAKRLVVEIVMEPEEKRYVHVLKKHKGDLRF